MKHAKIMFALFVFLFVFGSTSVVNDSIFGAANTENIDPQRYIIPSYETHGIISIMNDSDFESQAAIEMWSGDGSSDSPFIIQGYNITNDTQVSIAISDVSHYFEIRDCIIMSTTHENVGGITLNNVTHAYLENCIISNKNTGLEIDDSDGITVVNCTMDNNAAGVTVDMSNHTSFVDCYFTNTTTGSGFYQDSSHWTSVTESYFNFNGDYGGESYQSNNFTVIGCEITGNHYAGFLIENSHNGTYQANNVFGNGEEGFTIFDANHLKITENAFYDNDRYGLSCALVEYAEISHNTVYNNTLDGINIDLGDNSTVHSNIVYDNGWTDFGVGSVASGLRLLMISDCLVLENDVYNNSAHGIEVNEADDSVIIGNNVWENLGASGECGMSLVNLNFCNITSNTVHNNTENGITLRYSDDCIVSYNIIFDNAIYGLSVDQCNRTLIHYNDIGWNPTNAFSSVDAEDINYWDDGEIGNWWSNYGGSGPYNISGTPNPQDMHPSNSLVVGTASDVEYELGSTGNTLFIASAALNPGNYKIFVDSSLAGTVEWNGENIYADIDGLDVGTHDVTVQVFHVSGYYLNSSATVTVVDTTPPAWGTAPTNQTIDVETALSYQLEVSDFSEIGEWIVNDTVHFSIADGLLTNKTVLEVGYYTLNITVVDVHGNALSAVIRIAVTTISAPPADLTGLVLALGVSAGVIAVVVIIIVVKKKQV